MSIYYRYRWYHFLLRWCYSLILVLLLPLAILTLVFKSDKTKGQSNKNRERFGLIGPIKKAGILVHCVSLGEVNAAKNIVLRLQSLYPELPITISTTSSTGAKQAREVFSDSVQHLFLPIDIPVCMWLFFNKLKPKLVLVTEVEIWPNMLHQCFRRNIPVVLINGRMSNESVTNYQRLAFLFRPSLRKFTHICTQGQRDFDNFLTLGVYKPNLTLTNNMKFDLALDPKDDQKADRLRTQLGLTQQPVFVAGSTHDPEEKACLDAFKELKATHKNLLLIIVPRHPHRFEKVAQMCQATGYQVVKVSELADSPLQHFPDILLIDAMGWLKASYQLASFAFVGGSFAPRGGHNALEPALYGVPTIMGPSTFNNPLICQALSDAAGLTILTSPDGLAPTGLVWLNDAQEAKRTGFANQVVLEQNRGAIEQTLEVIEHVFPQSHKH